MSSEYQSQGVGVLVDANVLFSITLLRWLYFMTGEHDIELVFYTSEDILAEARYHRRKRMPDAGSDLGFWESKLPLLFRQKPLEFRARPGYLYRDNGLMDTEDQHVHFAALDNTIDILLTQNITDFPQNGPYRVMTPDEFLYWLGYASPATLKRAIEVQSGYYARQGVEAKLSSSLRRAQCLRFADMVESVEAGALD